VPASSKANVQSAVKTVTALRHGRRALPAGRYRRPRKVRGEREFLERIETLRGGQIDLSDLRVEADEWLISLISLTWLDRHFDRPAANERLQTLARGKLSA
jgi:hypothetical protein